MKIKDKVKWDGQEGYIHNIYKSEDGQVVYEVSVKNKGHYLVHPHEVKENK
jgi:hypothetical protein